MAAEDPPKSTEIVAVTIPEEKTDQIDTKTTVNIIKPRLCIPKKVKKPKAATLSKIISLWCFILSFPLLVAVIWLFYVGDYDCEKILGLSRLKSYLDIGLSLLFLLSCVVVALRTKLPFLGCFVAMVIFAFSAMVGLGLAGGFGFESGHKLPASPVWFKLTIDRLDTWSDIKHCIYDTRVCDYLITRSLTVKSYEFTNSKLSPLETGCCRPPGECEMEYVNATFWKRPLNYNFARKTSPYYADCDTWENNSTSMCFNCQPCKDAFFWTIESKWQRLGVSIVVMSIFLLLSHLALNGI